MDYPQHNTLCSGVSHVHRQRARHAIRSWLVVIGLCLFIGCASTRTVSRSVASDPDGPNAVDPIAAAFRAGMHAGLNAYAEHYLDNDFPYYNWHSPLVQRTWMPPIITGGILYPGHMADIVTLPGAWKREYAAPISSRRGVSEQRPFLRERPTGDVEADGPADGPFPSPAHSVATPQRPSRYSTPVFPAETPVLALPQPPLQRRDPQESALEPQTR
jgi:hypothetical protein